jgi:hypothetical protein
MKIGNWEEGSKGDGWKERIHSDILPCLNVSLHSNHLPLNVRPTFQFSFQAFAYLINDEPVRSNHWSLFLNTSERETEGWIGLAHH